MVPLVRDNLPRITELCRRHRVQRLFLFGSATSDAFDPRRSDVDFLVVFEPHEPKGWDDVYFLLLADLKDLLGREIDLIEAHLPRNPYFIASVNETKQLLYAA
ncbi:nucleotidyltransferase domain-containing protein [soil metagenome]